MLRVSTDSTTSDLFIESFDVDYLHLDTRMEVCKAMPDEPEIKAFVALDKLDLQYQLRPVFDFACYSPPASESTKDDVPADDGPESEDDDGGDEETDEDINMVESHNDNDGEDGEDDNDNDDEDDEDMSDSESAGEPLTPEQMQIEELRIKAMEMKEKLMKRWEKKGGHKKRKESAPETQGSIKCTYPGCLAFSTTPQLHARHIHTHYPFPYFCPVCDAILCRGDAYDRHVKNQHADGNAKSNNKTRSCALTPEGVRFDLLRDRKRFNFYFLGVMEDYPMSEEHFELISGRRRGSQLY
ncbi:hypothetical protein DFH11DRAFT_1548192 [Phellopilus nigrolimitatus]|nr:hypothetical protein DFH11DRAFT_1548192 [Phellopilus nigrolimitatus]